MSTPASRSAPQTKKVRCPICLDLFTWPGEENLFQLREGDREHKPLVVPPGVDPIKRRDLLRGAYIKCPNPSGDTDPHYLPLAYGSFLEPLIIGMVGSTKSGKSHLLAAMIGEIVSGALQPYDLTCVPVDKVLHDQFLRDQVERLTVHHRQLDGTDLDRTQYADALLFTSPAGTTPVAFFDVAGADLGRDGKAARFLVGVGGLIFVVDPGTALGVTAPGDQPPAKAMAEPAFRAVLDRVRGSRKMTSVPAALVINKADRLRFMRPVDSWLNTADDGASINAERWRQESRDGYALLYRHGATASLAPFHECRRCTMHFASATSSEVHGTTFPRGVRPKRVLQPLLALLAMAGVIPGAEAARAGRA